MRRIGVAMLSLVAASVLSALVAASASAAPTFQECKKVASGTGEFISETCSGTPTGGELYTRFAPAKKKGKNPTYKGKTKTVTFETPGVGFVTCKSSKEAASIAGESSGTDVITFSSCVATAHGGVKEKGAHCTTAGESTGTVKTRELRVSLHQKGETVEEALKGAGKEEAVAEFSCEGPTIAVRGAVRGVLTGDIDTIEQTNTVTFEKAAGLVAEVVGTGVPESTNETETASFKLPKGIGVYEGLETIEGDEAGVSGTVEEGETPVDEAIVSVCKVGTNACRKAITEGGSYEIADVPPGEYLAKVSPPLDARGDDRTDEVFTLGTTGTQVENFQLPKVVPPPPGTIVKGGLGTAPNGIPILKWTEPTPISTTILGCEEPVTGTVTGTNSTNGRLETVGWPFTENPVGSGHYSGTIPPLKPIHGVLTVRIYCGSTLVSEFTVYCDPSGIVVDANHGDEPVADATVTLLTAESLAGPFLPVPEGSPVMSPANRVNPDRTGADGRFRWDTVPGFYEVTASKPGCGSATSGAFEVPPPVTQLRLVLHCGALLPTSTLTPIIP